jgi:hypothetical protein
LIKTLEFKPKDSADFEVKAFYNVDQVKAADVKDTGLLASETQVTASYTEANGANCGAGFTTPAAGAACTGSCKYIFNPNIKTTTLKGSLFYLISGVKTTTMDSNVQVSAWKGNKLVQTGSVTINGIYVIPNIPVHPDTSVIYDIKIEDYAHRTLTNEFEAVVPAGADTEVSTGSSRVITADGKLCDSGDSACIAKLKLGSGTINILVLDAETGKTVSGSKVLLKSSSSVKGAVVAEQTTDSNGKVAFKTNYGYYNAIVDNSHYKHTVNIISLDEASTSTEISLTPVNSAYDFTQEFAMQDKNADMDLVIYAQNPKGYECNISPTNKYCAYGQHYKDSMVGDASTEIVRIKSWAVAKYKTVVQPAGPYGTTCPEFVQLSKRVL